MTQIAMQYIRIVAACLLLAACAPSVKRADTGQYYNLPAAQPAAQPVYGGQPAYAPQVPYNPYAAPVAQPAPYYQQPAVQAARPYPVDNDSYYQAPKAYNCNTIGDDPSCGGG